MTDVKQLITEHLDIWLTAESEKKSGRGRSFGAKSSMYGVQKLRELILDLAVFGKLVENLQGNIEQLIKDIELKKQSLILNGKFPQLKFKKDLSQKPSLVLPNGWAWIQLGDLGWTQTGNTPQKQSITNNSELLPFIRPNHITSSGIDASQEFVSLEDALKSSRVASANSLLMVCIGSIGKVAIVDYPCCFNQQINALTPVCINSQYLLYATQSSYFQKVAKENSSQTTLPILNKGKWEQLWIALPCLEEQELIVAKVDELMQLCDQLEQQQNLSTEAHEQLVDVLLNALTNSANADEFQQNWQRISANFDLLFTTDYSIEQLKQTILQLAVMGKLVKQYPTDEPASELLKQIAEEKAKLVKEGKIKKSKPLPEITDDEKPFELPSGWEWERLNALVSLLGDGLHGTPEYESNTGLYFINGNNLNDGIIQIKPETKTVTKESFEKNKKNLTIRTVLVSINGTIGNVAFYKDEPVILGKSACYFNLLEPLSMDFIKLVINSPYFYKYAASEVTGTTIKNLSLASMNKFPIPVPMLNEQKNIVEKVNQLFSIIDQLRVLQTKAQQTKLHLADVLVANAVEGA
ncbi:restriction endonuclease subunit S [Acinetobacter brisouii]|uniref:restriction endonuclease subunit S n=1 Tax=Acinetobacter brisouii TaxID=396323 RepID=UPI0035ADB35B